MSLGLPESTNTGPLGPEVVAIFLLVGGAIAFLLVAATGKLVRGINSRFKPVEHIKDLLYSETPIEISTALSPNLVYERLRSEISRFAVPFLMSERLVGVLSNGSLKVAVHHPFMRSTFAPVFVGSIAQAEGRTHIRGVFRLPDFARVIMTFWFGFLAIWSAVGIPAGLILLLLGDVEGLAFVIAPIGMFGFGILFTKLSIMVRAKDVDTIRWRICETIGGVVAHPVPAWTDTAAAASAPPRPHPER